MNACPDLLAALLQRRRDLELDATAVKSRLAEINDLIAMLERPQRRGRPRKLEAVVLPVQHVPGSMFTPDTDPDDDNGGDAQDSIGGTQ